MSFVFAINKGAIQIPPDCNLYFTLLFVIIFCDNFFGMASIKELTSNLTKSEKFVGVDFLRWQKKIMILFTNFNVAYVISTPKPKEEENKTLEPARRRGN